MSTKLTFNSSLLAPLSYVPQLEEWEYTHVKQCEEDSESYFDYACEFTIPPSLLAQKRAEFELFERNILNILDYLNGHISFFVLLCRLFPEQDINFDYYALSGKVVDAIAAYEAEVK